MLAIAGYQTNEKIYESSNSIIYRGYREADKQPVIFKTLNQSHPSPQKIAWFKREYEIIQNLKLMGVVKAYDLGKVRQQWVMVLEDFGGESLARLGLVGELDLEDFLPLAIQIVNILGQVHQLRIMHKDINPANIILNQDTNLVKLIDFGISTILSRENSTFRNPNVLEGTLAYISPEQTGRMNRAIDYRTDFYSLGVMFYELLTGQLPFSASDQMEIIHAHIARQPTPLHKLKPNIPQIVSDIIMKLLSKNAEDRYQSAAGLKVDLEECLQQQSTTEDIATFSLGQHDVSDRFQIPQKLYGRTQEIDTLLTTFDRITTIDKTEDKLPEIEMVLVSGYAGIGKSALVQEVYKPITRRRGHFIAGKFDQFNRNIPYAALIQAFQSLVRQLLTADESEIAAWQEKLLAALGPNGQIIIDVIPEVALIIGPQAKVPDLPPTETQNRFNLVFQNFIKAFTRPEHPLVLFLDDLQWADGASMRLLELLITAQDTHYMFLIGAYRDNEVNDSHPLILTVSKLQKAEIKVHHISLSPLELPHITQLITDTLHCSQEMAEVERLAKLVLVKTGGNPFFVNEFLRSLYVKQLLTFDYDQGRWIWNLERIKSQGITDNIVELMADKVQQLNLETQTVLKLAACIGNRFNLATLALVYKKSSMEAATILWPALVEGLVLPLSDDYKLMRTVNQPGLSTDDNKLSREQQTLNGKSQAKIEFKFAHDRIQQAVYSLLSAAEKETAHHQIGHLLLQHTSAEEQEKQIFDITNHLNLGYGLSRTHPEQDELAKLNLSTGKKAKASVAYQPALNYFKIGLKLLGEDKPQEAGLGWQRQYDLTLKLYIEAAEAAYLNGNFEEMKQFIEVVLEQARSLLDRVKVYEIKINAYIAQNKLQEAINTGLLVLEMLDIKFPKKPNKLHAVLSLAQTKLALRGKPIEYLLDLPKMTDPNKLAALRIMTGIGTSVYLALPALFPLLALKAVRLYIQYGNNNSAAYGFVGYGLILCGVVGDIDTGYGIGQMALKLVERFNAYEDKTRVSVVFNVLIRHWKEHIKEGLIPLAEAYQVGLDTGDLEYAANSMYNEAFLAFVCGQELTQLEHDMALYSKSIRRLKQERALHINELQRQIVLNLIGKAAAEPFSLVGDAYNENEMIPLYLAEKNMYAIFSVYLAKLQLCYLFQAYPQAVENAIMSEKYLASGVSRVNTPLFHFYDSLARLAVFPNASKSEQKHTLKKVAANQKKMKKWAKHAPMNNLHKFYLVEAERARVLDKDSKAWAYYNQAIDLANQHEYLNEEALAYELAAKFYLSKGHTRLAHHHLSEAYYAYSRWGALAKVKNLEEQYPQMLPQTNLNYSRSTLTTTKSALTTINGSSAPTLKHGASLDLASVFKASQAISGEIVLDTLLSKMIKIVIETAGAQRGVFILEKETLMVIEAEGKIDEKSDEVEVTALQSIPISSSSALAKIEMANSNEDEVKESLVAVTIVNYVARTRENTVLNDATHEGMFTEDYYIKQTQPKSILCVPMVNQGKLTGILYLENNLTTGAFTPDRVEVLQLLSTQIAISIENAGLYTNLEQSEKKYRTLFDDSKDTIFITAPSGQIIDFNPIGLSLFGYTKEEAIKLNAQDLYANPDDRLKFQQKMASQGSIKDFEIKFRKKDGAEIDCLVTATIRRADDGAILGYQGIIRNITARKQAEQERLQLSAIQRELSIAQDIQQSLLPPPKPIWPNLDVICFNAPAREVGGDFYSYHAFDMVQDQATEVPDRASVDLPSKKTSAISTRKYALAIGDVSGKGVSAALLMATSLSQFDAAHSLDLTPAKRLAHLDKAILPYTKLHRQNCAMCYVELEQNLVDLTTLRVVNAGCIPPYIKRVNGQVEEIEAGGFALGQGLGAQLGYQEVSLNLSKGDLIILTSDGVVEAKNAANEMFGFERLKQAVVDGPATSVEAMLDHLKAKVAVFVGETEPHDDLTIVVMQV